MDTLQGSAVGNLTEHAYPPVAADIVPEGDIVPLFGEFGCRHFLLLAYQWITLYIV